MVYCVSYYRVLSNNKCVSPIVLEKYQRDDKLIPFNIDDPVSCYKYLKKKYGYMKIADNLPIAFRIYAWGGNITGCNFFPGVGKNGKNLPLAKFGRLNKFYELYTRYTKSKELNNQIKRAKKKKEELQSVMLKEMEI